MNSSAVLSALWRRPRNRTEWSFTIGLGIMGMAGIGWLATHADTANIEALRHWLMALGGDTELNLKTPEFVRGGLMMTALVWVAVALVLWLSRGWWCFQALPRERASGGNGKFVIGLAVIMLLALGIRWPRMDLGLYNDEIDVFRTAIGGSFDSKTLHDVTITGAAPYRNVNWMETVWGNRIGNNHALQSILARFGFDAWKSASSAVPGEIKEWPLRIPALLGGLASIVAAGALAQRLTRSARAGLFTAFILAIHPWHVRYSTEARGYGLIFAFSVLAILFLCQAIERNQWRWWLAFGFAQACCLWSFLGSVHLILGINLAAAIALIWPRRLSGGGRSNPLRSPPLQGWFVATALSASLYFLMAAPALPPVRLAMLQNTTFQQGAGPNWWHDVLAYLFTGMPWFDGDPDNKVNPAILKYRFDPFVWTGLCVAVAASATGIVRLWARGGVGGRIAVAGPLLGVTLPWIASSLSGMLLLKWYVCYGTVFIALWMGVGVNFWISRLAIENEDDEDSPPVPSLNRDRTIWQRIATYGLLGLYAMGVARPLLIYRHQGKQSMREAIEMIRGGVFPFTDEQLHPLVTAWWTHANYYDPYLRVSHTPENLEGMVTRARTEKRPLFYVLGMREAAKAEDPSIIARLEESGEFSLVKIFPGLEEAQFRTYVYRLRDP